MVPELLDADHSAAEIETAARAIGAERARTLANAQQLAGDINGALPLEDAVLAAMVKHVDKQVGDALRRGDEVKWGHVLHLQKEVLLNLELETDAEAAFKRVRQERQTKSILETIIGPGPRVR